MTKAIVLSPLLGVGKYLISFVNLFELVLGVRTLPVFEQIADRRRIDVGGRRNAAGTATAHIGQQERFGADKNAKIVPALVEHGFGI